MYGPGSTAHDVRVRPHARYRWSGWATKPPASDRGKTGRLAREAIRDSAGREPGTHIFLRPIGSPLPLTYLSMAAGTLFLGDHRSGTSLATR